jgi:hypothetical protein
MKASLAVHKLLSKSNPGKKYRKEFTFSKEPL